MTKRVPKPKWGQAPLMTAPMPNVVPPGTLDKNWIGPAHPSRRGKITSQLAGLAGLGYRKIV